MQPYGLGYLRAEVRGKPAAAAAFMARVFSPVGDVVGDRFGKVADVVQQSRRHKLVRGAALAREVSRLQSVLAHAHFLAEVRLAATARVQCEDFISSAHTTSPPSS